MWNAKSVKQDLVTTVLSFFIVSVVSTCLILDDLSSVRMQIIEDTCKDTEFMLTLVLTFVFMLFIDRIIN